MAIGANKPVIMTTHSRVQSRLSRSLCASSLALASIAAVATASAQPAPSRTGPALRTPSSTGAGAAAPQAPGGAAAPADDPMANVKQAVKEIELKPLPAGAQVDFNLDDADLPD